MLRQSLSSTQRIAGSTSCKMVDIVQNWNYDSLPFPKPFAMEFGRSDGVCCQPRPFTFIGSALLGCFCAVSVWCKAVEAVDTPPVPLPVDASDISEAVAMKAHIALCCCAKCFGDS